MGGGPKPSETDPAASGCSPTNIVRFLQGWIFAVGLMSIGNAACCFLQTEEDGQMMVKRVYSDQPDKVNALTGRLFGTWALLAGIVRLYCAVDIVNPPLYRLTVCSFVVDVGHFLAEAFVYRTVPPFADAVALVPLVVAGLSAVLMVVVVGGRYVDGYAEALEREGLPKRVEDIEFDKLVMKRPRRKSTDAGAIYAS